MLKKITLVTLFISSAFVSAEPVQNDNVLIQKVEPVKVQAIVLEKTSSFKCSPFPFCVDYPNDDGSGGSAKAAFDKAIFVSKPK